MMLIALDMLCLPLQNCSYFSNATLPDALDCGGDMHWSYALQCINSSEIVYFKIVQCIVRTFII